MVNDGWGSHTSTPSRRQRCRSSAARAYRSAPPRGTSIWEMLCADRPWYSETSSSDSTSYGGATTSASGSAAYRSAAKGSNRGTTLGFHAAAASVVLSADPRG